MDDRSDGLLHQRLDRLEEKGRATLAAAARAAAWRRAVDLAARSAIVVPVLVLIVAMLRPVPALPAILFAVVVPLIVLVAAVAVRMARFGVERRAALAVIDRSLGLKDRSVIAAEFLVDDRRDGFRRAALQEAMPWLERAGSAPMEMEADPARRDRYRWVLPLLGLAILVAALAIRPSPSPGPGTQEPSALRRIAMAMGLSPNRDEVDADRDRAGPQARSRDGTAAATGGGAAAGSSASGIGAAGVTKNGASAADPAMPLGEARNGGGGSPAASGTGRAGGREAAGAMGKADGAQQPGRGTGEQREGDAKPSGDVQATAPESRATPPQGAQNGAAAGLSAPAGAPPAPRNPGGSQDQQPSGARNRQQSGQQSQGSGSSGRASNNGQQGSNRGDGQEGVKRARGSSALMLAVPMEDRVIGTVNAGAVSSTTRNAPPRAMASGMVAAQSRGVGQGPGATVPERNRSAQEDRLLERYFARPGVER